MAHLTSALVKPQFISLGLFLISYSTICLMAQSAPWGKPWQSHLPAHASTRRRRGADTASLPKEDIKHPTAQLQGPEITCTLTLAQSFRCLQSDSSSGGQGRTEQPSPALSGQREEEVPLPKSPWVSTDEETPWAPHRSISTATTHWTHTGLFPQENILTEHTGEHFVKLPVYTANVITKTYDGKKFTLKKCSPNQLEN